MSRHDNLDYLPFGMDYLKEDYPSRNRFLEGKPPIFADYHLKSGSKEFVIRLDDGVNSREWDDICKNLGVSTPPKRFFYHLEIKNTKPNGRKRRVRAKIMQPNFLPYVTHSIVVKYPSKDEVLALAQETCQITGDSLEKLLSQKYFNYDPVEREFYWGSKLSVKSYSYPDIPYGEESVFNCAKLCTLSRKPSKPFLPGESQVVDSFCYDFPTKTDENTHPGAAVSITYQHLSADGTLNMSPWKITIKNYTLVRKGNGFAKENVISEFFIYPMILSKILKTKY